MPKFWLHNAWHLLLILPRTGKLIYILCKICKQWSWYTQRGVPSSPAYYGLSARRYILNNHPSSSMAYLYYESAYRGKSLITRVTFSILSPTTNILTRLTRYILHNWLDHRRRSNFMRSIKAHRLLWHRATQSQFVDPVYFIESFLNQCSLTHFYYVTRNIVLFGPALDQQRRWPGWHSENSETDLWPLIRQVFVWRVAQGQVRRQQTMAIVFATKVWKLCWITQGKKDLEKGQILDDHQWLLSDRPLSDLDPICYGVIGIWILLVAKETFLWRFYQFTPITKELSRRLICVLYNSIHGFPHTSLEINNPGESRMLSYSFASMMFLLSYMLESIFV